MEQVRDSRTRLIFIGPADTDFDGQPLGNPAALASAAPFFAYRPEIGDVTAYLREWGVEQNQVPNGCVMQDGAIVLTAPAPDKPVGNRLFSRFTYQGRRITVSGADVVCLRLTEGGGFTYWSPEPAAVTVE